MTDNCLPSPSFYDTTSLHIKDNIGETIDSGNEEVVFIRQTKKRYKSHTVQDSDDNCGQHVKGGDEISVVLLSPSIREQYEPCGGVIPIQRRRKQ